jgi:hypothetical protein
MQNTTTTGAARAAGDGRREGATFRLEGRRRRVQVPQLVVAVVVIAVSALIGVVVLSNAAAREPVVALAADVARGEVVSASDLQVVYVASDDPVATLAGAEAPGLVGRVAVADLAAGSLLSPGMLVDRAVVAAGEGVVGLALVPGEYPTDQLAPGDVVDVIAIDGGTGSGAGAVVTGAEVFDVTELGTQGSRFVSLRMPAGDAATVARAAGTGGLRLVLVADAEVGP